MILTIDAESRMIGNGFQLMLTCHLDNYRTLRMPIRRIVAHIVGDQCNISCGDIINCHYYIQKRLLL